MTSLNGAVTPSEKSAYLDYPQSHGDGHWPTEVTSLVFRTDTKDQARIDKHVILFSEVSLKMWAHHIIGQDVSSTKAAPGHIDKTDKRLDPSEWWSDADGEGGVGMGRGEGRGGSVSSIISH